MVIFCDSKLFPLLFEVLQNIAFIYTLISLYLYNFPGRYLRACCNNRKGNIKGIIFFAILVIVSMLVPLRFSELPYAALDLRIGIIIVAASVIGIKNSLVVSVISVWYRIILGGLGWIPWAPVALTCPLAFWLLSKYIANKTIVLIAACLIASVSALGSLAVASYFHEAYIYISPLKNAENFLSLAVALIICNPLAALIFDKAIATTLEYKSNYDDLKIKASVDVMTGLYNHRSFQEHLSRLMVAATREKHELSLLILDLDRFKIYNDALGHQCGDKLLFKLGAIFKSVVRDGDIVARYGGEEFAIILPATSKESASRIAERIRRSVEEYNFYGRELMPQGKITVSIGVSSYPLDSLEGNELVRLADCALYKAKANGRNQVNVSPIPLIP